MVQQFVEGNAKRRLVVAGPLHVAGNRIDHGAGRIGRAQRLEPIRAIFHDGRHAGQGLGIVDRGGTAVQTTLRGERRLEAGLAGLAFQRLQEARLLAADIRARAHEGMQLEVDPGRAQATADQARRPSFVQRVEKPRHRFAQELAANVVVAHRRAHRKGGQRHALDQHVRVVAQDVPIVAGSGLALVGVADEVGGLLAVPGHEAPLKPGGKAGPATAPQSGCLDRFLDLSGVEFAGQHFPPDPVAAAALVGLQPPGPFRIGRRHADVNQVHAGQPSSLMMRSASSGVTFSW